LCYFATEPAKATTYAEPRWPQIHVIYTLRSWYLSIIFHYSNYATHPLPPYDPVRATKACAKNNTPCVFPRVPPVRNLTRFRTTHTHGPSTPLSYVLLPHTTWFSRPLPGSFGAAALVAPQFGLPPSTPCHCPRVPDPGHISVGFVSLFSNPWPEAK
jgi:hypothetical protein